MIIPGVIQAYFIFPVSLDNSRLSGKVMDIWIIQGGLDISSKTSNFQDIPDHVCCLSVVAIAVADAHRHTDTTDFRANQPSLAELELGLS